MDAEAGRGWDAAVVEAGGEGCAPEAWDWGLDVWADSDLAPGLASLAPDLRWECEAPGVLTQ